jgi:hypothetical protein
MRKLEEHFNQEGTSQILISGMWVTVDTKDIPRMSTISWSKSGAGDKKNRKYFQGYTGKGNPLVYLHRFILYAKKGEIIDHIDNDTLNNAKSNLRVVTPSQNNMNSILRKEGTSGYRGVTWRKDTKKWQAQLMLNGKHVACGCYLTKEAAFSAYLKKTEELFGEYSRMAHGSLDEWKRK